VRKPSSTRGLRNFPSIVWNGTPFEFQQDSGLRAFRTGLHAPLALMTLDKAESVKFSLELAIEGIEQFDFVPVAKNNQVTISSKWPHPQFGGRFLPSPKDRTIGKDGFSATWNISALSSNAQQQLMTHETGSRPSAQEASQLDHFSVAFIEPINIYSQADRVIKYGLLFVALTFAAFFLFEVLKQLPIHPVQYTLVGLALTLFFLLLVSLSEHIRFMHAYALASAGCILLIGFYLAYVLHSGKRGIGFGSALTLLYGVLFGLLQSESNALVMGSILLFGVLAAMMIVTRKVDWYQLGKLK
jgi:inner membrane protein